MKKITNIKKKIIDMNIINKNKEKSSIKQQANPTYKQYIKYNPKLTQFGCDNTQIQINRNKVNKKLNSIFSNIERTKKKKK